MYKDAAPQEGQQAEAQPGADNADGNVYDADYKVVDEDENNK